MKLYLTRLTFPDLQREEFSAKRSEPAEGALLEFVGLNVPVMDMRHYPIGRERRSSRAIGRDHDPRVYECVPRVNQYERGDLP